MMYYNYFKNFFKNFFHHSIKFYFYIILLIFFVFIFIQGFLDNTFAFSFNSSTKSYFIDDSYLDDYYIIAQANNGTWALLFTSPQPFWIGNNNSIRCDTSVYSSTFRKAFNNSSHVINDVTYDFVMTSDYPPTQIASFLPAGYIGEYNNNNFSIVGSNFDLKNRNNEIVFEQNIFPQPSVVYPEITTSYNDFINLNFDVLSINAHDFSNDDLYLLCYDKNFEGQDSFNNLYPVNEILLNYDSPYYNYQHTSDPTNSAIYWIPRQELGLKWYTTGKYSFRFALRVPIESEFSDWAYEYLTDDIVYQLSSNLNQSVLDEWNKDTEYFERNRQHEEIMGAFDSLLNDNISSENEDSLNDILGFENNNSDLKSVNTAFFSRLKTFLEQFLDYDFNEVENLVIPVPHSDYSITFPSDYLSRNVSNTIKTIIGMFWIYVFGLYAFKYLNNLCIAIENGDFIDPNKDPVGAVKGEVILSNML